MAIESKKLKVDDQEKGPIISFSNEHYCKGFDHDHDDLMVITATIHNYIIKKNFQTIKGAQWIFCITLLSRV